MGTRIILETIDRESVVMYLLFVLSDPETRYYTTEKEALVVIRCLEECRWLVKGVEYLVILYMDYIALKTVFSSTSDANGRIIRWLMRL